MYHPRMTSSSSSSSSSSPLPEIPLRRSFSSAELFDQFKELEKRSFQLMHDPAVVFDTFESPVYMVKNRYCDILPFEHSIVPLRGASGCEDPDHYINACFIPGNALGVGEDYIATQGPTKETSGDFWEMIIEQNVRFIVMVTSVVEKKRIKCHQYWPSAVDIWEDFGACSVLLQSENFLDETKKIIQRDICVRYGHESPQSARAITHLQFTGWPDFGVPNWQDFLRLNESVDSIRSQLSVSGEKERHPLVVHCSAGIGRSGVFIAVDSTIQKNRSKESHSFFTFDLMETIMTLRTYRMWMVQTKEQYEFCYNVLQHKQTEFDQQVLLSDGMQKKTQDGQNSPS